MLKTRKGFVPIIIVVIIVIIAAIVYAVGHTKQEALDDITATATLNYLNKKYGDQDFEVTNVMIEHAFMSSNVIGFTILVTTPLLDGDTFSVYAGGSDQATAKPSMDTLLTEYYKTKTYENFADTGLTAEVYIAVSSVEIPNNYGHFPTPNDIYKFDGDFWMNVKVKDGGLTFGDNQDLRLTYLKKTIDQIAAYYEVPDNFAIRLNYPEEGLKADLYIYTFSENKIQLETPDNQKIEYQR